MFSKEYRDKVKELLVIQNNICPICEMELGKNGERIELDVSEETGRYRGVLCFSCNMVLQSFNEDPGMFMKAIDYLEEDLRISEAMYVNETGIKH